MIDRVNFRADEDQNQTNVILHIIHYRISFFNVLLLQYKAKIKIEIVEFPDLTGDKQGLKF